MLTFLKVKGFAIIDELQVEFGEGFNVITGETGAGKSIIINALSTLMNAKISSDMIRSNAQQAEVIGHFFYSADEFVLRRIMGISGRSRAFLNDNPVTLSRLEETGNMLINIYGQNEFQYLLNKESYTGIIDSLLSLDGERQFLGEKVGMLKKVEGELERKKKEVEGRGKEIALLRFQVEEIERENVKEGEEELIKERLKTLKDAEKIKSSLGVVVDSLYEGENSVHVNLKRFTGLLKSFSNIEAIDKLKNRIESISFDVEDVLMEIKDIEKGLLYEPDELQMLEERLSKIYELKNKYGKTYKDIEEYEASAKERLAYLTTLSENIGELEKKKSSLESEVGKLADRLTMKRKKGTGAIEKAIVDELSFLSMKGLKFEIEIADKGSIDEDGRDDIEFMISTNPGEPLKPLRKIASGGELSRIMLAIKKVIGGEEEKTLIFDEVDAGIGGRVADMVGRRLKDLAKKHQVICITHLPQIAVYGDHHFLVEKYFEREATKTGIKKLSEGERVAEIARMSGGTTITEKTLQRAEEMLQNVEKSVH
jgi:DNA repair protein RecN (Recombination protein N)